jgi:hypothetical protein
MPGRTKFAAAMLFFAFVVGNALGTVEFKPAASYSVGTSPGAVAIGDFNGDGKPDLVVANAGNAGLADDGNVSVLLGNGDGTFQAAVKVAAGKNPASIVAGDFNGDGKLDLAVSNRGDPTSGAGAAVIILLGKGDGSFQAPTTLALQFTPVAVVAGDFNGDLKLDLAIAGSLSTFNGVVVLLGNGDGSFQAPVETVLSRVPSFMVVNDFNGDGKPDLAVSRLFGVDLLLGNGDGSFQIAPTPALGIFVGYLASADFNLDHKADLLVRRAGFCFSHCQPAQFSVFLGNGDGTLQTAHTVGPGVAATVADFDGDGKPDLALASPGSVNVLVGNGDGSFQAPVNFAAGGGALLMAAGDLNGDKAPDLVLTDSGANTANVLLNTGTDFSIASSLPTPNPVARGQKSTAKVTLSLLNKFDNPVALTCSVQGAQTVSATCSFSEDSVTFDAEGKAVSTLTISTAAGTASAAPRGMTAPASYAIWLPLAGMAFVGAGCASRRSRSRKFLRRLLLVGAIFAAVALQAGCGGGGSSTITPETISVTVTASAAEARHSTTVLLTVQ